MFGWQIPSIAEASDALWALLAVVLVVVAVALVRSVAHLSYFGGHENTDPDDLNSRYAHGDLSFEQYEELREKKTHGFAH